MTNDEDQGTNPAYSTELAKNGTRRLFFWLTFLSATFTILWFVLAGTIASGQEELDARCDDKSIFDDDWGEVCGEALGNAGATGVLAVLGIASAVATGLFFLIYITRDRYKTRVAPIPKPRRSKRAATSVDKPPS